MRTLFRGVPYSVENLRKAARIRRLDTIFLLGHQNLTAENYNPTAASLSIFERFCSMEE